MEDISIAGNLEFVGSSCLTIVDPNGVDFNGSGRGLLRHGKNGPIARGEKFQISSIHYAGMSANMFFQ